MSITTGDFRSKVTSSTLLDKKQKHEPITCLTAYDYASARLVDEAGIDMILVGDSLGMVMLGYENTLPVTVEEMLHHTRAVRRGVKRAFLIADMPFASYHVSGKDAVRNAARFIKAGAEAVKIEGGEKRSRLVERLVDAEIPVVGHIGLTPQSLHAMGGYKVQGKTLSAVEQLVHDALALERCGACCMVLEGIPREVAALVTREIEIPTIGIGAGPDCDGQVLVFHDLLGLTFGPPAKFVRRYAELGSAITSAVQAYRDDVKSGGYPSDAESYHLPKDTLATLQAIADRKRAVTV
ncbi:MAG TPA: 3-methyl-2-oxobutanoate hydroxymethyltransferase [Candidatus Eisenbacteria bacterium]|nr:3-methyl-2-oxobutanoate hydroxymethyltransferase [Candidatus Eisenbacteria bacterium]